MFLGTVVIFFGEQAGGFSASEEVGGAVVAVDGGGLGAGGEGLSLGGFLDCEIEFVFARFD
mgnify:FL=1